MTAAPRNPRPERRRGIRLLVVLMTALAMMILADLLWAAAMAQGPFGVGGGAAGAAEPQQAGGVVSWLLAKQAEFYRAMSGTIRAARDDGSAVVTLLGIAFFYGIFHAAGPGHGKAVISSYLVANEETARRGIALSFASALMQALVAVAIVGVAAWLLNVSARTMCDTERVVEIASYALIAALGARLMWIKGGGLFAMLKRPAAAPALAYAAAGAGGGSDIAPTRDHAHDRHHDAHAHAHAHVHDDGCGCGHSHGPDPAALAGPQGWRHGLAAVLTVGIRPCSGAILVLVFALAQGLFWAGIAATFAMALGTAITVTGFALLAVSAKGLARRFASGRAGRGTMLLRGIEFGAATLVALFGLALLFGYMAAERTACF